TGAFTAAHQRLWDSATAGLDDTQAGTRVLIEVLLLHRHMNADDVTAGIGAALAVGAFSVDIVALEARKHAQAGGRSPTVAASGPHLAPQVTASAGPAVMRRIAGLPCDARPVPRLDAYDRLLTRTPGGLP
ncbi:MAG: IS21 family transposase, partial [Candidatus Dormibacteria bacterium]